MSQVKIIYELHLSPSPDETSSLMASLAVFFIYSMMKSWNFLLGWAGLEDLRKVGSSFWTASSWRGIERGKVWDWI